MPLYDRILLQCKSHHLTEKRVEELLNFSKGTFRRWKTSSPSSQKVLKVANFFNVSVDFLIGHETSKKR